MPTVVMIPSNSLNDVLLILFRLLVTGCFHARLHQLIFDELGVGNLANTAYADMKYQYTSYYR